MAGLAIIVIIILLGLKVLGVTEWALLIMLALVILIVLTNGNWRLK